MGARALSGLLALGPCAVLGALSLAAALLGLGALFACALLVGSASLKIVLGAVVLVLVLLFLFIAIDNKRSVARSR